MAEGCIAVLSPYKLLHGHMRSLSSAVAVKAAVKATGVWLTRGVGPEGAHVVIIKCEGEIVCENLVLVKLEPSSCGKVPVRVCW